MSEFDFASAAERMFSPPATVRSAEPIAPAARPDPDADRAERMFGKPAAKPPAGETPSDAEVADKLFGGGDPLLRHGDAGRAIERSAMEDHLSDPDEAKDVAAAWAYEFDRFDLSSTESAQLADLGAAVFANPATPELVLQWAEEAKTALAQDFGPHGAAQALADARLLIEKFGTPELRDVLDSTGLGSRPEIVRLAAAKARALRLAGKL